MGLKNLNKKGLYKNSKNPDFIGMEEALVNANARPRAQIIQANVTITGLILIFAIKKPLKTPIIRAVAIQSSSAKIIFPVALKANPATQLEKTIMLPEERSMFPEIITNVMPTVTMANDAFCCIRLNKFPTERKELFFDKNKITRINVIKRILKVSNRFIIASFILFSFIIFRPFVCYIADLFKTVSLFIIAAARINPPVTTLW